MKNVSVICESKMILIYVIHLCNVKENIHFIQIFPDNMKDYSNKISELFLSELLNFKEKNSVKEAFIVGIHVASQFSDRCSQKGIGYIEIEPGSHRE